MKQARYKEPLPLAVIEAARAGDAGAVEQVLQYYNGYINKLCKVAIMRSSFYTHRLYQNAASFSTKSH